MGHTRLVPVTICAVLAICSARGVHGGGAVPVRTVEDVEIDAGAPAHGFPHFWEETFGAGRASLALRESYRNDLRAMERVTAIGYLRFHDILDDDVGVYDEDANGNPVYNFSYVDQIYDGLLALGVRPFVELSFMPGKLAAQRRPHPFWYHPNVSPPKSWEAWDALIRSLAAHLVARYGIEEVSRWYFEVWNEPNIDFWAGEPKRASYFELYDHTARALKSVDARIRVGGPATAAAHWVSAFLDHTHAERVPVDFVSSHGYADDTVEDLFGTSEPIPMDDRVCRAIAKVHGEIAASGTPGLPLMWTEWNVPSFDKLNARDTIYLGPALANTIRECDGLVDMMSFWTFSDVFDEDGPGREPFEGGFAPIAMGGIRKPGYVAFALLHALGERRLANSAADVLVTRRGDGTLVVAAWNLVDPDREGSGKTLHLRFRGVAADAPVTLRTLDSGHGNTLATYRALGSPRYPTRREVESINRSAALQPQAARLDHGLLALELSPDALALIEVAPVGGRAPR
jgi:xylan 1,4-beta-xylosidase